ncbi:cell adhesion molecule DSCAM-like [Oppia nitens]|uniref:cell adhesion molecule DSCAM-like n=1 Tax=Oppia nitens TaxID=1686743 RepID=UPI0023DC856C|nr:cell adhesion molecule DSCAM-like [Oppia nitens]
MLLMLMLLMMMMMSTQSSAAAQGASAPSLLLSPLLSAPLGLSAPPPPPPAPLTFRVEPPPRVLYSNKYGTVIPCSMDTTGPATDNLKITWMSVTADNTAGGGGGSSGGQHDSAYAEVNDVVGLRLIREDGSLCLLPFPETHYTDSIHNTVYVCVASLPPYGQIGSRFVKVKAVIDKQPVDVRNVDSSVSMGSDVILHCHFVQHLYEVSLWISDDGLIILPVVKTNSALGKSLQSKHHILMNGDLLITDIDNEDVKRRYRCQVANRLTGERTDSSNWSRIVLIDNDMRTGLRNNLSPSVSTMLVPDGQSVAIYCSFDGQPDSRPDQHWYYTVGRHSMDLMSTARMTRLPVSTLSSADNNNNNNIHNNNYNNNNYKVMPTMVLIGSAQLADNRRFICVANNTGAEQRSETQLIVRSSLRLHLSVSSSSTTTSTPSLGDDIILNCSLTVMDSIPSSMASSTSSSSNPGATIVGTESGIVAGIKWFRNMRPLVMDHRIRQLSDTVLTIRSYRHSDIGIVQCFVHLKDGFGYEEWLQSAAVLTMEERAPVFTTVFSEQIKMSNTDLSLKCAAVGQPPPIIYWKLDDWDILEAVPRARLHSYANKVDRTGSQSQLNISSITMKETGVYQCIAHNLRGTVVHRSRINIMGSLYIKPIGNVTAIAGHSLTINCSYAGYPIDEVFFLKGNRRLPLDERHSQPSIGRLAIASVDSTDQDMYKCVVLSLSGQRMEQTFHVKVIAPPVISPFMFSDNLEENMRCSAVCSVISGEPPITIKWFKDGKPLLQMDSDIQIVSINEFISSLIISNIRYYHRGNYTCVASSAQLTTTSTNFTATMRVRAAPQWIVRPADRHTLVGQSLVMDCQSSGYPQPVTRWKFIRINQMMMAGTGAANGLQGVGHPDTNSAQLAKGSDAVSILSSPQIHVLENGSLAIRSIETHFQGIYICDVGNGVGRPLETSARLFVNNVPTVQLGQRHLTVRRSGQLTVQCTASGTTPLTIRWLKNGFPLSNGASSGGGGGGHSRGGHNSDRSLSSVYIIREELTKTSGTEKYSQLTVNNCVRNDTAVFTCVATNLFGSESQESDVVVQEPPDAPHDIHSLDITARSATVSWVTLYTGNSPIIKHSVQYKRQSDQWFDALMIHSTANTVTISNLLPMTGYDIRVKVDNEIGSSEFSTTINIVTTMEAPSIIPQDVHCVPLDSRSIKIQWSIVSPKSQIIDGFYIGFKPFTNIHMPYTYKTMQTSGGRAGSGGGGGGGGGGGEHELVIQGGSVGGGGGGGHHYQQQQQQMLMMMMSTGSMIGTAAGATVAEPQISSKYDYNIESLSRRTKYIFIIQAFNSMGAGPSSAEIIAETFANDPPEAPLVKVDSLTTSDATLIWDLMSSSSSSSSSLFKDSDGNQVDGFIISYRMDGNSGVTTGALAEHMASNNNNINNNWETIQLSGQHKKYVLRNLRCGTSYIVKVEAFNDVGTGRPSDELRFSTVGKAPVAADRSQQFTANITFVLLHLNRWSDGGCPISHFSVQYKPRQSGDGWTVHSNDISSEQNTVLLADLRPGTWYDVLVGGYNEAGQTQLEYRVATLTTTGSTVEPLSSLDGSSSAGGSRGSIFEDPVILIPAFCAVLVLVVVSCATGFILIWKSKESGATNEPYCRHRENSRSDDLSLNSYNKVPKTEPIYDRQRLQVYYPNGYHTEAGGGGGVSGQQLITTGGQDLCHQIHFQGAADVDCGDGIGAAIGGGGCGGQIVVEPSRGGRRGFGYVDHVYDVPHRMLNKQMADTTKLSSYSLLWKEDNCPEAVADSCLQMDNNSLVDSTGIPNTLTNCSISSRDNESIYSQSTCFHEIHKLDQLKQLQHLQYGCPRDQLPPQQQHQQQLSSSAVTTPTSAAHVQHSKLFGKSIII